MLESGIEDPLISKEDLQAGTGYSITSYPQEVIDEAEERLKNHKPPSKPAEVPDEKPFELKLTGHPMETWLLLGMYIDYGYSKQRDVQAIIQEEIARRWEVGMHLSEFRKYFKDWGLGPERFGLDATKNKEKETDA